VELCNFTTGVWDEALAETDLAVFSALQKPSPDSIFFQNDSLEHLVMIVNFC